METTAIKSIENMAAARPKKDRREYYKNRYRTKKEWYHNWYLQRKSEQKKQEKESRGKYYEANYIRILMPLKDYINNSPEKKKLWLDFCHSLKNLDEEGVEDIIQIMRLRELADNLIGDYWETAKGRIRKDREWNKLTPAEQASKLKYWEKEYERREKELFDRLEEQEEHMKRKAKAKAIQKQNEGVARMLNERKDKENNCNGCQELRVLNDDGYCKKCVDESNIF